MSYISVDYFSNKLYIKEYRDNQLFNKIVEDYIPKLYIEDKNGSFSVIKNDIKIKEISSTLENYYDDKNSFKNNNIKLYNDFSPSYQYISDKYYGKDYDMIDLSCLHFNIKVLDKNIDIENEGNDTIYSIQVYDSITNLINHFTFKKHNLKGIDGVDILNSNSEVEMIEEFISFVREKDPIILNTWFGDLFDFPYLINRCKKLNIDYLALSPFNKFKQKRVYVYGKSMDIEVPIGRYFIDYHTLYNRYSPSKRDSYELNSIANHEFKEKTTIDNNNEHLKYLYDNDYEKYIEESSYFIKTLNKLDSKLNYIKIMIEEAWTMGVNFDDVFSTIKPWTYKLYNELKKKKQVLPYLENKDKESYLGGHILKPKEGKYSNIISFDISSNYTNIIITNNISYETIVDLNDFKDKEEYSSLLRFKNNIISNGYEEFFINASKDELKEIIGVINKLDLTISSSGEYFYKNKDGILPEVMQKIFKEREQLQEDILSCEQQIKLYKKELKKRGL